MALLSPDVLKYGAGGLVGVIVLLILFGRLVPRATSRAQTDRADREAERWRTAYEDASKARDVAVQQSSQLLASMETIETLVRSIVQPSRGL